MLSVKEIEALVLEVAGPKPADRNTEEQTWELDAFELLRRIRSAAAEKKNSACT
ncbi:hypothetical protein [Microvirga puerhi]|uniref:Uncharacterized protein n=1 Tax=Microvirga puerhi TaxID=2876078 RepID=A0ABS7VVF5_9HYPH|nr:hypothetical protein [Microvirga puerhi]MBZ6078952.1 hypothetical protein [Microvirga puerhi]